MRLDLVFPRFKLLSGAERAILGLAAALVDAGHRPRIVCHQFHPSCRARVAPGVEVVVTGQRLDWFRNRYLNAAFDYLRTIGLGRALDPRADAVVVFGPALLTASWRRTFSSDRRPLVYYCWEPPRALYQDRRQVLRRVGPWRWLLAPALTAYRAVDRWMVRRVDAVCTSSPFAARRIADRYDRGAEVITLGIDRRRLDRAVASAATEGRPSEPVLLSVNYLHPRKRVDMLLEALARLLRDGGPAGSRPRALVVGDGPERQRLGELADSLSIADRVRFAGFVPDDELPATYAAASCYVHTAREESFGLSVIEAAYCGLPVVAVDEGGVGETVVDGVTGYRVAATAEAVAEGVRRLLERPDRGAEMGRAGRAHVAARYRWEQGAAELTSLVDGLGGTAAGGDPAAVEP